MASRMRKPQGPALRMSEVTRSTPPGSNSSWIMGQMSTTTTIMMTKNAMSPTNLKMSAAGIGCPATDFSSWAFASSFSSRSEWWWLFGCFSMASSLMQPPHDGGGFQELFTLVTKS